MGTLRNIFVYHAALLLLAASHLVVAVSDFTIGLRALVLTTDQDAEQVDLPRKVLESHGMPFDILTFSTSSNNVTSMQGTLYDASGSPRYNAFVFTSQTLGYQGSAGWVASAISAAVQLELDTYRLEYGVRTVFLSSSYDVDQALQPAMPGSAGTSAPAEVRFIPGSNVTQAVHNSVPIDAVIKIGKEHEFLGNTYWSVPAVLLPERNADNHIEPFMTISYPTDSTLPQGAVAAFIRRAVAGDRTYEAMHFLFNTNNYGLHGAALGNVWLPWVTRGVFLGQRRMILSSQVDDVYLDTGVYNTTLNRQALDSESDEVFTYRVTANDLANIKSFQDSFRTSVLPPGSNFTIEFAINAKGYIEFNETSFTPNMAPWVQANRDTFLWVTHTWNHIDMYCVLSNCTTPTTVKRTASLDACVFNGVYDPARPECVFPNNPDLNGDEPLYPASGHTPKDLLYYELQRNIWFANTILFPMTDAERAKSTWSSKSIVTPRISGLNYTESIEAMLAAGLQYAVGDNSRKDLRPINEFHAFMATAKIGPDGGPVPSDFSTRMTSLYGQESIMVIPRWATRIYFDVSIPLQDEMEHNSFYGPNCIGHDATGEVYADGPIKCNITTFKYPRDLTVDEIMSIEGFETARNLFAYVAHPYMFHQGNMRTFSHNGKSSSLLSLWLEAVAQWITRYSTLPVLTYKQDDLAEYFKQRMARDECGIEAKMQVSGGNAQSIALTSAGSCEAKVTVTPTEGGIKALFGGSAEQYGVDTTYIMPLVGAAVSVSATGSVLPTVLGAGIKIPLNCSDGLVSDGENCMFSYVDAQDAAALSDLRRVGIRYDATNTLVTYELFATSAEVQPLSWVHSMYIDTDRNSSTGWSIAGGVQGADVMVQGSTVYTYTGTVPNIWSWAATGAATIISTARITLSNGVNVDQLTINIGHDVVPAVYWSFTVIATNGAEDHMPDPWVSGYSKGIFEFDFARSSAVTTTQVTSTAVSSTSTIVDTSSTTTTNLPTTSVDTLSTTTTPLPTTPSTTATPLPTTQSTTTTTLSTTTAAVSTTTQASVTSSSATSVTATSSTLSTTATTVSTIVPQTTTSAPATSTTSIRTTSAPPSTTSSSSTAPTATSSVTPTTTNNGKKPTTPPGKVKRSAATSTQAAEASPVRRSSDKKANKRVEAMKEKEAQRMQEWGDCDDVEV